MRVTENEIKKLIHQSNLIEGYDDVDMDYNSLSAWRYLNGIQGIDLLTERDIMKVQRAVTLTQKDMRPEWRGKYRQINVHVGGRPGAVWKNIPPIMGFWLSTLRYATPKQAHINFEHIHPFADGNGRTGRLLMWWHEMLLDQPLTKLTAANRQEYYQWF